MYFKARKSIRIQTSIIGGAVEGHGKETQDRPPKKEQEE